MLNNVSILIPFGSDNPSRLQAFEWIQNFYKIVLPDVEVCIGKSKSIPFSKSEAINHAAAQATREIYVIADSDIFYDPSLLIQSIKLLEEHTWVIPFQNVYNLDQEITQELLEMEPNWPIPIRYKGIERNLTCWGGVNIIPRRHFERVAGFDERFKGWGGEDDAFALSVNTLCGSVHRLDATIYHLWHPPGDISNYESNIHHLLPYIIGKESILREIQKRRKSSGQIIG